MLYGTITYGAITKMSLKGQKRSQIIMKSSPPLSYLNLHFFKNFPALRDDKETRLPDKKAAKEKKVMLNQ